MSGLSRPRARAAGTTGNGFGGQPADVCVRKWRTRPKPLQFAGSLKSASCSEPVRLVMRSRRIATSTPRARICAENASVSIVWLIAILEFEWAELALDVLPGQADAVVELLGRHVVIHGD